MRLPSAGAGSVYVGDQRLAEVHYTIKRTPDGLKADLIVVDGDVSLETYPEVTLKTKEGEKIACRLGTVAGGVCTFHINELG